MPILVPGSVYSSYQEQGEAPSTHSSYHFPCAKLEGGSGRSEDVERELRWCDSAPTGVHAPVGHSLPGNVTPWGPSGIFEASGATVGIYRLHLRQGVHDWWMAEVA